MSRRLAAALFAALTACTVPDKPAPEPAPPEAPADLATVQPSPVPTGKAAYPPSVTSREMAAGSSGDAPYRLPSEPPNRENYAHYDSNPLHRVAEEPVSTFSVDVDTGSYANVRRLLNAGALPPQDAVRVEEMINYFDYAYPVPASRDTPFNVVTEIAPTPWNPDTLLLHVGIKAYEVDPAQVPAANLVFLVDVSGSMNSPDKLGLLKSAFKLLARQLRPQDRVSIVVYAGAAGLVLNGVTGDHKGEILAALEQLQAGGSTNGGEGIRLAYALAEQHYIKGGINRILLATDGDFNVGTVDFESLVSLAEERRRDGVSLTTLGFGTGNYNDQLAEQLADAGNGNYAYIDTLNEGRKVLVDQLTSTLMTVAKDVKIQIEFNPRVVAEYRLIGYENRMLRREDFNNDKVDAGEIGAGHTVTALYEIALAGAKGRRTDPLRYTNTPPPTGTTNELAFLRLRYKAPDGDQSRLMEQPIARDDIQQDWQDADDSFRFAAAVAAFGQALRGGDYLKDYTYADIETLAEGARGRDAGGFRGEFLGLVRLAESLATPERQAKLQ